MIDPKAAYEAGFTRAAEWAGRDDLPHDTSSGAYFRDRDKDLRGLERGQAPSAIVGSMYTLPERVQKTVELVPDELLAQAATQAAAQNAKNVANESIESLRKVIAHLTDALLNKKDMVPRSDFEFLQRSMANARRLLCDIYASVPDDKPLRDMIEARSGNWFVWGLDRSDNYTGKPVQRPVPPDSTYPSMSPLRRARSYFLPWLEAVNSALLAGGLPGITYDNSPAESLARLIQNEIKLAKAAPKRQYFYGVNSCKAISPADPGCVCWHDEGAGPLADTPSFIQSWRAAPSCDNKGAQ